jgi:hypothetical protein
VRLAFIAIAPVALVAASEPAPPVPLDMPSYQGPARQWETLEDAPPSPEECRDRITHAREQAGQPRIERETAHPDKPMMIWAVDRREDGCSVMVVAGDPDDIRPLPDGAGKAEMIPAR